jgi:hypothetical protein
MRSPLADRGTTTHPRVSPLMALLPHRHNTVISVQRVTAVVAAHVLLAYSHNLSLPRSVALIVGGGHLSHSGSKAAFMAIQK